MTSYKGICIHRLEDGSINHVQVEDPHGNQLSLSYAEYFQRKIQPPIDDLPECKSLNT